MLNGKLRWYQTWYGVVLVGLVALIVISGLLFLLIVGRYFWLIKHGQGQELSNKFNIQKNTAIDSTRLALRQRLELADRPFLGSKNAPVTIVVFIDFKCPFCKSAEPIIYQVAKEFGDKVKIIIRQFPLESIHAETNKLSEFSYCALQQGAFWQAYNEIFDKQDQFEEVVTSEDLFAIAASVGLNEELLKSCLVNPDTAKAVRTDFSDGVFAGVKATPTFFVNGDKVEGVVPFKIWEGYFKNL
ncbi:MAG: thioredoxin domain-containing protein [Candidatus Magasanikbacteria bacterium]